MAYRISQKDFLILSQNRNKRKICHLTAPKPLSADLSTNKIPKYKPQPCFVCGRKVLLSGDSFGFEAVKGTNPVEVRVFHWACV